MMKAIAIAVSLLLCFSFCATGLTYAFFWCVAAKSGYRAQLNKLSGGRSSKWLLMGILSGFFSLPLVILFFPLCFCRSLWQPKPDPACSFPPVILVHGLYHNASAWIVYRFWLRQAGFTNVYAMDYNSWRYTFQELLQQLEGYVQKVSRHFPDRKVVLIGHSLGGLLCRAYGDLPGAETMVDAVVTLGTPHHGSVLTALGLGKLARSLGYAGSLIKQIEQMAVSSNIRRLAIFSPVDSMVLPSESLQIKLSGWNRQMSSPVSHVAMLYSRSTASIVVEYMKSEPLQRKFRPTSDHSPAFHKTTDQ